MRGFRMPPGLLVIIRERWSLLKPGAQCVNKPRKRKPRPVKNAGRG